MQIEDIRRANLNALVTEKGGYGALVAIATDSDVSAAYLSQILTRTKMTHGKVREVGSKLARKLERGCNKPTGWMDTVNTNIEPGENELRALYTAMNENARTVLLEQARLISKIKN